MAGREGGRAESVSGRRWPLSFQASTHPEVAALRPRPGGGGCARPCGLGSPAAASVRWPPPPPPPGAPPAPPAPCPPHARRSSSRSGWRPPGGSSRWRAAGSRLRGARFQPWPWPRDTAGRTGFLAARPPSPPAPARSLRWADPGLAYWARFRAEVRVNHGSPTHSLTAAGMTVPSRPTPYPRLYLLSVPGSTHCKDLGGRAC